MAECKAIVDARTREYDLRAPTRDDLDAGIRKITEDCPGAYGVPQYRMKPLQMIGGDWRAIVLGKKRVYHEWVDVFSNVAIEGPEQAHLANGPARMEG